MTRTRPVAARLGRADVLAYRTAVQQLTTPARTPGDVAVLGVGLQDTPRGSALLALRARVGAVASSGPPSGLGDALRPDGPLRTALLVRGAPHVVRRADLARLTAATGPLDDELAALADEIAAAMRTALGTATGISRPDLSGALNGLVPDDVRVSCERCGSRHVPEASFRAATARAGLVLDPDAEPVRFVPDGDPPEPVPDRTGAVADLGREFVHLVGPTRRADLATWLGHRPGEVAGAWDRIAGELVPVDVDGTPYSVLHADLDALTGAGRPDVVRLLPPLDPFLLGDRDPLVPDKRHRTRVWRPIGSPGVLLADGDVAGTWRRRRDGGALRITVEPFRPLPARVRDALHGEAAAVAATLGAPRAALDVEAALGPA